MIPDLERAVLHQKRGHDTAAGFLLGLEHDPLRADLRRGLEIEQIGGEQDHVEQVIDPRLFRCRDFDRDDVAAPLLDLNAVLGQLAADALDVRVRLVDLVDGHDDRHLGGARMVDGFSGLRHDTVVGRDDEDDDVGHLRAAGTHHGEGLVARRVEEDDLSSALFDVIRTDVLRDAARLAAGDVRLADGVEERGLAVIDVTHDGDDRSARR